MELEMLEPEVSLPDLFGAVWRNRRGVATATACAVALTAAVVFIMPVRYTAEAVVLPPQPEQSAQAMMAGGLAGLTGLGALGNSGASSLFRNPGDLYAGLLKSRTVADALISRFDLKRLYGKKTMVDARKSLARRTTIETTKDLLIHVRVEDADRTRAAAMANAYIEELHSQNSRLALTSAAQRRLFFETRLREEKEALAAAEVALKTIQESSGLVYPSGQSEVLLRSIAQLRAEIAGREVELQSIRIYATPENPQVRGIEEEISGLRAQLKKVEATGGTDGDLMVTARQLPDAGMEYLRKVRDLKYHEALYELLGKQYEAARIDEAKQSPLVQVVDQATPPDKKSWPPRALFIALAGILAAIASCAVAIWRAGPAREYERR